MMSQCYLELAVNILSYVARSASFFNIRFPAVVEYKLAKRKKLFAVYLFIRNCLVLFISL